MASFNEHGGYPEDQSYNIKGDVLNEIAYEIQDLRAEIAVLKNKAVQDELADLRIRDKNPAVKDAWDKYQTVLGLAVK